MGRLAAVEPQSDADRADRRHAGGEVAAAGVSAARMVARARWLMITSGLTTLVAIAAVIGVIGYRVYHGGGSGAAAATPATVERIVALPKGARVTATAVAGDHVVVTLDIAGSTEIRTFDVKTLTDSGRLRFVPAP